MRAAAAAHGARPAGRRRARAGRRGDAGRHPQPAGRPGHPRRQRRRGAGRRDRRSRAFGVDLARSATSGSPSPAPPWPPSWCTRSASLGREGATPVKLALAGAALTRGCSASLTQRVVLLIDARDARPVPVLGGRLARRPRRARSSRRSLPFLVVGVLLALCTGPGAERAGARRRRGPRARPADVGLARGRLGARPWCCSAARRPRPAGRSPSSA